MKAVKIICIFFLLNLHLVEDRLVILVVASLSFLGSLLPSQGRWLTQPPPPSAAGTAGAESPAHDQQQMPRSPKAPHGNHGDQERQYDQRSLIENNIKKFLSSQYTRGKGLAKFYQWSFHRAPCP